MNPKHRIYLIIGLVLFVSVGAWTFQRHSNSGFYIGQQIDSFNGVAVLFNGKVSNVSSRNTTADGYNLGLKYQCVEFVKRYYYQQLNHKMPDSYGHAKDFFNKSLSDGQKNRQRNLTQYTNPGHTKLNNEFNLYFWRCGLKIT